VKAWLSNCLISHEWCIISRKQRTLKRLLALDSGDLRLCLLSNEIAERPKYATISYYWGSLLFQTLKSKTLETFESKIQEEALSKIFPDAIEVVRFLEFKYLWIDSLCIVQDDHEDWATESSFIAPVYGGSSLNIPSSSATDGSEGCFFARSNFWRYRIEASVRNKNFVFKCSTYQTRKA
jgi:hypothetical protein